MAKAIAMQKDKIVRYGIISPVMCVVDDWGWGECIQSAQIRLFMHQTLDYNRYCKCSRIQPQHWVLFYANMPTKWSCKHDRDQVSTVQGASVSVQSPVRRLQYIRDCSGGGGQAERQRMISRVSVVSECEAMPARTVLASRRMPWFGYVVPVLINCLGNGEH